jgi:hypothetical protein
VEATMTPNRIGEPNRTARASWEEIRAGITPEAATLQEPSRRTRRRQLATQTSPRGRAARIPG